MPHTRPPIKHSTIPVHWIVDFARQERVRQRITQAELSLTAGVSGSTVGQYEEGVNKLAAIRTVERILAALGHELHIRKKGDRDESIQKHIS